MKYIKLFDGLSAAKQATLLSPTLTAVAENGKTKMLVLKTTCDDELHIEGDDLDHLVVKRNVNTFKLSESKLDSGATYAD